jgi:sirohydrochlorin ferrochelatase
MSWFSGLMLAVGAFLTGVLTLRLLVCPAERVRYYALLLGAAVFGMGLFLAAAIFAGQGWAVVIPPMAAIAGYLLTTRLYLVGREERSFLAFNPGPGTHTAVIYLTHGEPPGYDPSPWLKTFHEFDQAGMPFMPWFLRPIFLAQLRRHYRTTGGSPHNRVHAEMLAALEAQVRGEGDTTTRFYLSFLDTDPRPDEAAVQAVNQGANRIILVNVFLTNSSHTQAGAELIDALKLEERGVSVCRTEPLYRSELLQRMFVERADRANGGNARAGVGILLAGHGQPPAWDRIYASQTEQENSFRLAVVERLVEAGYTRENIALGWMEFKPPKLDQKARELAARGVEKVFVFASSISAASLHSEYDIPQAAQAGLPPGVELVNLGAWNNDPLVIRAIREQIRACGV